MFQIIQKHLVLLGFDRTQQHHHHHPFERKHLKVTGFSAFNCISVFVNVFYVADNIKEYMDSLFLFTLTIALAFSRASTTCKTLKIYELLDNLQGIFNESELTCEKLLNKFHSCY